MSLSEISHAMRRGNETRMEEILSDCSAAFTRVCFEYALRNGCTLAVRWFLEPDNYRKKSGLFRVMVRCGHCQGDLRLWDAMVARLWPFRNGHRIDTRTQPLDEIHPDLLPVFLERGLVSATTLPENRTFELYRSMEKIRKLAEVSGIGATLATECLSMKQISKSFSYLCELRADSGWTGSENPCPEFSYQLLRELISRMPDPLPQEELLPLIKKFCDLVVKEDPCWDIFRRLLSLVPDIHVDREILFRDLVVTDRSWLKPDTIIAFLEQCQVDLLRDDYTMLLDHSPKLFPFFHERCKGETFQIWKGAQMKFVVSQYPMRFPGNICRFRLDQMHGYSRRQISLSNDQPLRKLVPGRSPCNPLDDSTTDYQTTTNYLVDGELVDETIRLPDFLIPAFLNQPSRAKSARSAMNP